MTGGSGGAGAGWGVREGGGAGDRKGLEAGEAYGEGEGGMGEGALELGLELLPEAPPPDGLTGEAAFALGDDPGDDPDDDSGDDVGGGSGDDVGDDPGDSPGC